MIFQWGGGGGGQRGSVHASPWMHHPYGYENPNLLLTLSMGHLSMQYGTSLYTEGGGGGGGIFMIY